MAGLRATLENDDLVIRIPRNKIPKPSSTGKTLIVASSNGNLTTQLAIDGQNLVVGFNAYIPNPDYVKPPRY